MCGRFAITIDSIKVAERFNIEKVRHDYEFNYDLFLYPVVVKLNCHYTRFYLDLFFTYETRPALYASAIFIPSPTLTNPFPVSRMPPSSSM